MIQFNFSYLHWSTVWCCQKIEELKIENLWTKNSLFPCHTQTNLKYISWNGKNTVQSTSKMIFNFLNSYFDKKLYGLMLIILFGINFLIDGSFGWKISSLRMLLWLTWLRKKVDNNLWNFGEHGGDDLGIIMRFFFFKNILVVLDDVADLRQDF